MREVHQTESALSYGLIANFQMNFILCAHKEATCVNICLVIFAHLGADAACVV